ncbi:MAG: ABC transporter ATP-binding protein [Bacteroidetes bacterium]|nr:MAG: ABC transporter ATP-binding protein [Bacteroidota bacterium]
MFISFFESYWRQALAIVFLGLVASLFTILIPVSIGKYFDLLFGYHSHRAQVLDFILPASLWQSMRAFQVFFLIAVGLRFATSYGFRLGTALLGERFSKHLRELLFEHQLRIPLSIYQQSGTGKYLLRYSGDMKSAQDLFTKGMLRLGSDLIVLTLALGFMWWYNVQIFLIVAGGMLFSALLIRLLNKWLRRASVVRRDRRSGMLAFVSQRLQAIATIVAFNRFTPERARFQRRSEKLFAAGKEFQTVYQLIYTIVPGLLYLILALCLMMVHQLEMASTAQQGNLLAFVLVFLTILPVFRRLLRAGLVWEMGLISIDKLMRILQLARDDSHLPDFHFRKGRIEVSDLTVAFDGRPLIQNLHFTVEPGEMWHIRGRSGSGKTTLIQVLMGLLPPSGGQVRIDGQDVSSVNGFSLRKHLTAVSTAFPLLGKTVFEAVSYNQKEKNRERAARLLERLQRHLPQGRRLELDTPIGELGSNLSSGEQKMLQYIRAMMTRKPIVLIEEPLKGLHPAVRTEVVKWLGRQKMDKTILLFTTARTLRGLEPDAFMELGHKPGATKTTPDDKPQARPGQ